MSAPLPKPAAPAKKSRSPAEKVIVWGGIAVLIGLAAVQAHARFGYEMSLKNLQARVANDDDGSHEGNPLFLDDVPGLLVGFPSKALSEDRHWHVVTYTWQGLGKTYTIRMPYDTSEKQPMVLSLETGDAPPEPDPMDQMVAAEETTPAPGSVPDISRYSGGGGMGPGGPGGGGPPRNLMDNDKDGDGKVSKEEAPERLAQNFDQIDTNGDGFIDAEEAEARRRQREAERAAGGGPGGPGGPGGGNRRPQAEDDAPADAAAAAVKAVASEAKPADEKPAEEKSKPE